MLELFLLIPNFSLLDGHSISIRCFSHHPCSYPHSPSHSHLNSRFLVSSGDLFGHPLACLFTLTLTSPPPTITYFTIDPPIRLHALQFAAWLLSLSLDSQYHTHLFYLLRHPLPLPSVKLHGAELHGTALADPPKLSLTLSLPLALFRGVRLRVDSPRSFPHFCHCTLNCMLYPRT